MSLICQVGPCSTEVTSRSGRCKSLREVPPESGSVQSPRQPKILFRRVWASPKTEVCFFQSRVWPRELLKRATNLPELPREILVLLAGGVTQGWDLLPQSTANGRAITRAGSLTHRAHLGSAFPGAPPFPTPVPRVSLHVARVYWPRLAVRIDDGGCRRIFGGDSGKRGLPAAAGEYGACSGPRVWNAGAAPALGPRLEFTQDLHGPSDPRVPPVRWTGRRAAPSL